MEYKLSEANLFLSKESRSFLLRERYTLQDAGI